MLQKEGVGGGRREKEEVWRIVIRIRKITSHCKLRSTVLWTRGDL